MEGSCYYKENSPNRIIKVQENRLGYTVENMEVIYFENKLYRNV